MTSAFITLDTHTAAEPPVLSSYADYLQHLDGLLNPVFVPSPTQPLDHTALRASGDELSFASGHATNPSAAQRAQSLQSPLPSYKIGQQFSDFAGAPTMRVLPPGALRMGAGAADTDAQAFERPARDVLLAYPLAVSVSPVTFDQWDACLADDGTRHNPSDAGWGRALRPVINVSWYDAQEYVAWLARKTGHPYRLLSEAEWEHAFWARQPQTARFPWGHDHDLRQLRHHAWYDANAQRRSQPVGQLAANPWQLVDLLGNVGEWVEDAFAFDLSSNPANGQSQQADTTAAMRVIKGGSWLSQARGLRPSARDRHSPHHGNYSTGFRVAMSIDPCQITA